VEALGVGRAVDAAEGIGAGAGGFRHLDVVAGCRAQRDATDLLGLIKYNFKVIFSSSKVREEVAFMRTMKG